jgi:hypothetical protein
VRIPLDYYRILGLPLAASEEQLRQAYSDRIVQLPRREYSQAAISYRKQLIEEAYLVLSDPKERKAYDKLYVAHAYGTDGAVEASVAVENPEGNSSFHSQSLSIEIYPEQLVGALLILQELGEYELVLKLGQPYLTHKNGKVSNKQLDVEESDDFYSGATERSDVVLTVALACLELGREQWHQGNYENAGISLETGAELLSHERVLPNVQQEIESDLYRLRPYRILELLALPEENAQRTQGLRLLQDILDERGGIDGTQQDKSGLNIDDFLRFIQQLRNYLTVAEQHKLFEAESKRPSAVATYLAVYALIARGFSQGQPAFIRQAKQMLMRLGKRQDVHLEQSLCALLLGQTEEATRALELSQEYEALAFIREHSQNSPDLLPGLCLYVEHWLQNEVFLHFRDLAHQKASLKQYFVNKQVQAYLEALPNQTEKTNQSSDINNSYLQSNHHTYGSDSSTVSGQMNHSRTTNPSTEETSITRSPENLHFSPPPSAPSSTHSVSSSAKTAVSVTPLRRLEDTGIGINYSLNGKATPTTAPPQHQKKRRRRKPTSTDSPKAVVNNRRGSTQRRRRFPQNRQAQMRLIWMVFGSLAGLLIFWLAVTTTFRLFTNLFSPTTSSPEEQLLVQINQPPLPIPDKNSKPQIPTGALTEETAAEVIEIWLSTKALALGPEYEIDSLKNILVGSVLSQWRLIAQQEKAKNHYRQYEHTIKIESVNQSPGNQNQAAVEATVNEVTEFYEDAQLKKTDTDVVRVRYTLVLLEDGWHIREMSVLNNTR